jgi:ATP-dependent RNA helicase RhlE
MRFKLAKIYGGVNQQQQVNAMKSGVDVLIATPGRLLDLVMQNHVCLRQVQMFVLDEADRMLDMGFLPDLRKIIARLPDQRQSLFFSATLPKNATNLANRLLFNPVHVNVETKPADAHRISQSIRMVQRNSKFATLRKLLARDSVEQAIVFTRTKHCADRVAKKLTNNGINSIAIHGNKSQNARQNAIENIRQKRISVLVATDVASRGIDLQGISHVINYDMPVEPECYVHRIGRTARAGSKGVAISLCTVEEHKELRAIEKLLGKRISVENSENAKEKRNRQRSKKPHAVSH